VELRKQTLATWAPAGMDKRGHLPTSGNVVKCFCILVVTAKRSVDELFMHYFHKLSSASGNFASRPPPEIYIWTPNLPTPGKNPAGAHGLPSTKLMFLKTYCLIAISNMWQHHRSIAHSAPSLRTLHPCQSPKNMDSRSDSSTTSLVSCKLQLMIKD